MARRYEYVAGSTGFAERWHPHAPAHAFCCCVCHRPARCCSRTASVRPGRPRRSDLQDGTHGQGHAENHDWYKELKQPGTGYSCCNGTTNGIEGDCRPTRAYQDDDGKWRALINGRWVDVPPRVVLQSLAPDGNSHICASKSGLIYCFGCAVRPKCSTLGNLRRSRRLSHGGGMFESLITLRHFAISLASTAA